MPQFGPIPAEIAILGDYPSRSGDGYSKTGAILSSLGISATSCYFTTIVEKGPEDDEIKEWISDRKTCPGVDWQWFNGKWVLGELVEAFKKVQARLVEVNPKLVIALGPVALFLTTGHTAIAKWRGSRLTPTGVPWTVVPTLHPRTFIKQPDQEFILRMDLKRAYLIYTHQQIPRDYTFQITPSFDNVVDCLLRLLNEASTHSPESPLRLSGDLETRAANIACFGIAWSKTEAICIPHLIIAPPEDSPEYPAYLEKHPDPAFYWSIDDETFIVSLYAQLFHHPNILWVGQNFLYDCQYFWWRWGIIPVRVRDTMIGHHALHSNIRKGLDFLSSMYAHDHVYWKEDIRNWNPDMGERQYWEYNAKDACITYEVDTVILETLEMRNV